MTSSGSLRIICCFKFATGSIKISLQQLLQWVVLSAGEVRAEFDLMTVLISDKALLISSLFVCLGGCLLMLLHVVSVQTENEQVSHQELV